MKLSSYSKDEIREIERNGTHTDSCILVFRRRSLHSLDMDGINCHDRSRQHRIGYPEDPTPDGALFCSENHGEWQHLRSCRKIFEQNSRNRVNFRDLSDINIDLFQMTVTMRFDKIFFVTGIRTTREFTTSHD
jgi:hypothetical protein